VSLSQQRVWTLVNFSLSAHFLFQDSFNGAKSWVKELQRRGDPNVVIALAGNKADMEGKRKVQTEEAQQYALENDIIFLETSAKTALNVRNLFVEIGKFAFVLSIGLFMVVTRGGKSVFLWVDTIDITVMTPFFSSAKKLPKVPLVAERESFPIVPPKGKDKGGCC